MLEPNGLPSEFLSAKEVAAMFGVHLTTVYRWIEAGKIAICKTPGGRHRIRRIDAERFNLPRSLQ